MNKKDRAEMFKVFSEALHELVPPLFEDLKLNMATKEDIGRLERKLDAQQDRLDRHGK